MARPSKLNYEIQQLIGENVALGLTYALAAASAGITYQTFNDWMNKGKNSRSGEILGSINISKNAMQKEPLSVYNA